MGIEQAVEGFCPPGQFDEVAFQRLGEGVKQRPGVARCERLVARVAPFVENARDELVRAHADIHGAHHEVVRGAVFDLGEFVDREAGVLMMPAIHEFADGALDEARQVAGDVRGVLAGQLYLTGEAEVVADENARAGGDAGGEGFVVRVPQAEHPAVILSGFVTLNFHEAEVAQTVVAQAVGLGADDEAVAFECVLDLSDEFEVRERSPGGRGAGRGHELDFLAFDFLPSAMEAEIRTRAFDRWWLMVKNCDHDVLLSFGAREESPARVFVSGAWRPVGAAIVRC